MIRQLHISGGEKGGVGKSLYAKLLIAYLLQTRFYEDGGKFTLVECDRSNPDVGRIYRYKVPEFVLAYFSDDPSKRKKADPVLNAVINTPIAVINLPAQVHKAIEAWLVKDRLFELTKDQNIRIIYWYLCNGGYDSTKLFLRTAEDFGPYMQIVFVRNWGICDDWEHINNDQEVQTAISTHNIPVIDLPKFPNAERNFIEAHQLTLAEAHKHPDLHLPAKQRLKTFQDECFDQIRSTELIGDGEQE